MAFGFDSLWEGGGVIFKLNISDHFFLKKFFSLERDGLVEFSAESNGRQPRGSEERKNYPIF